MQRDACLSQRWRKLTLFAWKGGSLGFSPKHSALNNKMRPKRHMYCEQERGSGELAWGSNNDTRGWRDPANTPAEVKSRVNGVEGTDLAWLARHAWTNLFPEKHIIVFCL
jgi:hypothetical protein